MSYINGNNPFTLLIIPFQIAASDDTQKYLNKKLNISLLLFIIFILSCLTIKSALKSKTEKFCQCTRGQTQKICVDPKELSKIYEEGKLTENNYDKFKEPSWTDRLPIFYS